MSATAPAPVEGGPGAPAAAAVGPQTLGEYARGWWIGVKSGELVLPLNRSAEFEMESADEFHRCTQRIRQLIFGNRTLQAA